MLKIAIIAGSTRPGRKADDVARWVYDLASKRTDATFEIISLADVNLPLLDEAIPPSMHQYEKEHTLRWAETIAAYDGFIFVTPEYNRSMPGVLKNAIDHASRPYGQSAWAGKPAGVLGASIGTIGTALAQQHLRNVLVFLNMHTLAQPEVFLHNKEGLYDAAGKLNAGTEKFLQAWVDTYVAWVKKQA